MQAWFEPTARLLNFARRRGQACGRSFWRRGGVWFAYSRDSPHRRASPGWASVARRSRRAQRQRRSPAHPAAPPRSAPSTAQESTPPAPMSSSKPPWPLVVWAGRAKCTCESKPHSAARAPLQNQVLVPPTLLQLFGTAQPSTLGAGMFSYCRAASAKNPCESGRERLAKVDGSVSAALRSKRRGRWVGVVDGVWILPGPRATLGTRGTKSIVVAREVVRA